MIERKKKRKKKKEKTKNQTGVFKNLLYIKEKLENRAESIYEINWKINKKTTSTIKIRTCVENIKLSSINAERELVNAQHERCFLFTNVFYTF